MTVIQNYMADEFIHFNAFDIIKQNVRVQISTVQQIGKVEYRSDS